MNVFRSKFGGACNACVIVNQATTGGEKNGARDVIDVGAVVVKKSSLAANDAIRK